MRPRQSEYQKVAISWLCLILYDHVDQLGVDWGKHLVAHVCTRDSSTSCPSSGLLSTDRESYLQKQCTSWSKIFDTTA